MHIPDGESTLTEHIGFFEALESSGKTGEYDRNEWIYVPDFYTGYRYILGTKGTNPVICIGVNPSTASPDALDNTLKSVERIARANGYDSFIMFNVYPQRATNPDDMDKIFNESLHKENLLAFEYILSGAANRTEDTRDAECGMVCSARTGRPAVWAAWGAVIEKRPYLVSCVRDLTEIGKKYGAEWFRAGKCSKAGHPHHPLYLKKDEPLVRFDAEEYLADR